MEKKLPNNWIELDLEELIGYALGGDWGKDPNQYWGEGYQNVICIRGSELKNWRKNKGNTAALRKIKTSSLEKRELMLGDILLEISGGGPDQPVGRTVVIDKEVLDFKPNIPKVYTNFFRLLRIVNTINKHFINYFLQHFYKKPEIINYQGGSNNLRNLRFKDYITIKVPIPPVIEQTRIVAKLDRLFSHLDTLKARLDAIPELLKQFRQAVLTQAVTGKLTEEWRKNKNPNWKKECLNSFSESRLGKMLDKNKNTGELTDYLRNVNVRWFSIDLNDINQMRVEKSELKTFELKNEDVLVCEGGEPGRTAVWRNGRKNIIFQKALHRVRLKKTVLPEYFVYNLFVDATSGKLNELFTGTTIKHLTGKSFANYEIRIPPLIEQIEIVKRVENLFAKVYNIETQYKTLKEQIDNLPQAILAKTFRGELVEQDMEDESAEMLLERIKTEREKAGKQYTKPFKRRMSRAAERRAKYK